MAYPSTALLPSSSTYPEASSEDEVGTNNRIIVRELPRTRLHVDAVAPNGRRYRWGEDEPDPAMVAKGIGFSTTAPGGFDSLDLTLPRRPKVSYADLVQLSTLRVLGPGGQVAGEYRLEASPRVSGDEMSVSPSARGWQAHLEDDKSARFIYVDRDLDNWQAPSSFRKAIVLGVLGIQPHDGSVVSNPTSGVPGVYLAFDGNESTVRWQQEMIYDAGVGLYIGTIYYEFARGTNTTSSYDSRVGTGNDDGAVDTQTGNLASASSSTGTHTAIAGERFGFINLTSPAGDGGTSGQVHEATFSKVSVWGNHSLTKRGTAPDDGLYASDVIAHAVRSWAPRIRFTEGASGTLSSSAFIIPHLAFPEPTTAMEIISTANRFHLRDWFVWEDPSGAPAQPTLYYHERGARGRSWRARIAPSKLSEAGPNIENLWNGVVVRYNDVDGTTKTVGPTNANTNATSAQLLDTDPANPANQSGIRRWTTLDMGGVSTLAGATEVGRRFLVESAQFNNSGQAQLVGYAEDDKGVIHPSWKVRAGDTIRFVDAADTSSRRIVRTTYSDDSRTCSIDLDAPPEGLAALLERLQVVITPLGL